MCTPTGSEENGRSVLQTVIRSVRLTDVCCVQRFVYL